MSNIFASAVDTTEPIALFERKSGETAVPEGVSNSSPLHTNSFDRKMLVENRDCTVWTHPYSVWNSKTNKRFGLAAYLARDSDRVFGEGDPAEFFSHPVGVQRIVLSSSDFKEAPLSLHSLSKFAATARFSSKSEETATYVLVQGMGFVTGVYHNCIPKISSQVGFKSVEGDTSPRSGTSKYKVELDDGTKWLGNEIIADKSVDDGIVQICFASDVDTKSYDAAAGCYASDASISASIDGNKCSYSLSYSTKGSSNSNSTLVFALPHHVEAFDGETKGKATSITLQTTTKGKALGILSNKLTMVEELTMKDVTWDPATTIPGKKANYSQTALEAIREAAKNEVNGDVEKDSNVDSMYFGGKVLAKYAFVLLKESDFGNGHYNDHHFHWGYHIQAAAITAFVDKDLGGKWIDEIKHWVNSLVRDIANPTTDDKHFPVFRAFENFYNGHSWAKGLYASADGKDEEVSPRITIMPMPSSSGQMS
ncbi:endo-1,3-beta-glucanase Eng2 [Candidozyma auris]